jgi:hypothetical protein
MTKPRLRKILPCIIALLSLALYSATRGNVRWRVLRYYPHAEIALRSEGNHDPSLDGMFWRALGIHYFSPFEQVSIRISDHPTPIDFTRFNGMSMSYLTLQRCVIADIRPLLTMYRPQVSFTGCDLSGVPDDQKPFLYHEPRYNYYYIYTPPDRMPQYPGGVGLHSESFYP